MAQGQKESVAISVTATKVGPQLCCSKVIMSGVDATSAKDRVDCLSNAQLSDGSDATGGGSPRNRRHHGVMTGIRKKKIATAVITPAIGRVKKIARDPCDIIRL